MFLRIHTGESHNRKMNPLVHNKGKVRVDGVKEDFGKKRDQKEEDKEGDSITMFKSPIAFGKQPEIRKQKLALVTLKERKMPCSQSERKENYHNFRLVSANPQKVQGKHLFDHKLMHHIDESKPFEHSSTKKIIDSPSILRYIFSKI